MIDKEILLLKVEQLEFTSEKIESFLEKYHKDSTDDTRVRIADYVNDYCIDNPEVYPDSVRRELANILFPELKLMGGGAIRCKYLEESVETLCKRVPQIESVEPFTKDPDFFIEDKHIPY